MDLILVYCVLFTLVFELITILGRLRFGSKRAQIARMKKKPALRIHHLYTGVLILALYLVWPYSPFLILGVAFTFSDALHHFVVLPLWVGRTEFP